MRAEPISSERCNGSATDLYAQRGSHVRITTQVNGEHHEVIPLHSPIKVKTISSILKSVAAHHQVTVEELLEQLGL